MSRSPQAAGFARRRGGAGAIAASPSTPVDDAATFVEHPDGWYWIAPDGRQQFGPFESCALARADRDRPDAEDADDEGLEEIERVAGLADRIDADPDAGT